VKPAALKQAQSMLTIEVHDPNQWPEKNQAEFLFVEMVAKEYQLEVRAESDVAYIGFKKGYWTVSANKREVIALHDNGLIEGGDDLDSGFLKARYEVRDSERTNDRELSWLRIVPAQALWDYVSLICKNVRTAKTVTFIIHQPGRNGEASETGILCSRKDW